jgi:hypothetical protein
MAKKGIEFLQRTSPFRRQKKKGRRKMALEKCKWG